MVVANIIRFKGAGKKVYEIIFPGTGFSSFEIHGGDGEPKIGIGMKSLGKAMGYVPYYPYW